MEDWFRQRLLYKHVSMPLQALKRLNSLCLLVKRNNFSMVVR